LLAQLVRPEAGNTMCDPACGSGSLLIQVTKRIGSNNYALFGQESNGATWSLCKMNMFLHEADNARIEWCNTLSNPQLLEQDELMRFDRVVANPPFSLDKWGAENAADDKFRRFHRGIPPKSRGDFAFISHMIEIAKPATGRVAVIVPHGVLFRAASEQKIRKSLIEENLLDAVIGLPANLFFGTGIPAAIMIFDKGRKKTDILFIDASREFENGTNQNKLRPQDIEKIAETYNNYKTVDRYAHRATRKELEQNDYNLNIPRYVDTFEPEEEIDILAVQREIDDLETELAATKKKLKQCLKELGV
jgi:type I restriction enzyme M protein